MAQKRLGRRSVAEIATAERSGPFDRSTIPATLRALFEEFPRGVDDAIIADLSNHFRSPLRTDSSISSQLSLLQTVLSIAADHGIDPFNICFDDLVFLLQQYRDGAHRPARSSKTSNGPRKATSMSSFTSMLGVLHRAAGRRWILLDLTARQADVLRKFRTAWLREDAKRAQAEGSADAGPKWLGFMTAGPTTLNDLVLYEPSSWADKRDRAWLLLQAQSGATWARLSHVICTDLHLTDEPHVTIHRRDDTLSAKRSFRISTEVASALRVLSESVVGEQSPEAPLFQSLSKPAGKIWSGNPLPQAQWTHSITRVMTKAAEASPLRMDSMATVEAFTKRLTPLSVPQGLIADCVTKGF